MRIAFLLAMPLLAQGQLALYSFDGTTETPVGATYNYGTVASGSTSAVRFHARDLGNASVQLTTLAISGSGFAETSINGSVPYTIAPGNFLEFTITFTAGSPAAYSAAMQVNSIDVLLLATSVPAPVLTVFPSCKPDGTTGGVDFPSVNIGALGLCNFSLQSSQSMVITKLAVTGNGFQISPAVPTPFTLQPNAAMQFVIRFTPVCGTLNYSGMLVVNTQSFALSGAGLTPPLPKASLNFDASTFGSAQQHTLSITLATAAVCAATGYVNLAFASNASTGKSDDASVIFLNGSVRSLPFSVAANATQISIGGQNSTAFQTGTTAGTITFTLSQATFAADPTTVITIPPAIISITSVAASNQRLGELDVQVIGYDNTYSAGAMQFTFFDAKGNAIGSAIGADFTANFKTYFATQTAGSSFLFRVSFPVEGDQTQVATVQATLTNTAGPVQTGTLTFQ